MPELRSGARQARLKSKKLDDLLPLSQPIEQAENCVPPPNRTRRRAGVGRGRGSNVATVAKKAAATPVRPAVGGRGRGAPLVDLEPDQPWEILRGAAVRGAQDFIFNQAAEVADKDLAMDGGSGGKIVGAEDETSTTPIPERVQVGNSPAYKVERKLGKGGFGPSVRFMLTEGYLVEQNV